MDEQTRSGEEKPRKEERLENLVTAVNEKQIYQGKYNESIGLFVGVRFKFLGAGEVASYSLTDQNGNVVNF